MKELPVEVTSESLALNEKYKAFRDDEVKGMKRLNPAVLSAINQLNELYHGYLNIAVYGNTAYVAFDYYYTGFSYSSFRTPDMEYIKQFYDEIFLPWGIANLLYDIE